MDFTLPYGHFFLDAYSTYVLTVLWTVVLTVLWTVVLTVLQTVVLSVPNSTDSTSGHFFMTCTVHTYIHTYILIAYSRGRSKARHAM